MYNSRKLLIIMLLTFLAVLSLYAYAGTVMERPSCGDGACRQGEECSSCPQDCYCRGGRFCYEGKCVETHCGNGKCEPGENFGSCCDDCGPCQGYGERCNIATHTCEVPEAPISDDMVREIITTHFAKEGKAVANVTIRGSTFIGGRHAKTAAVDLTGDPLTQMVAVTTDGEVFVYPRL